MIVISDQSKTWTEADVKREINVWRQVVKVRGNNKESFIGYAKNMLNYTGRK